MFSAMKFVASSVLACVLILLAGQFSAGRAATFTVTKTADTNNGFCNGDCSLREAIMSANSAATNDTINFAIPTSDANCANNVCTIALVNGELLVKANGTLTINNNQSNVLLLSGGNQSRVFFINANANLTLNNLTLRDGNAVGANNASLNNFGGAIANNGGALTVTNSIIGNNSTGGSAGSGGGIYTQGGSVAIVNSQIVSNTAGDFGGGLANDGGAVTVTNSIFGGNTATNADGGGIDNYTSSRLTIFNCTVSNNSAAQIGGGIANDNGTVNIYNSTVSGNTANGAIGGGGIDNSGNLKLVNVTIAFNRAASADAANGGGIWSGGATSLRNTIIAANTVGDATAAAPDAHFEQGAFNSLGNNLIGNITNPGTQIQWNSASGTSDALNVDARLAALNSNGGATPTHALQTGSAAIGKGNACVLIANGCGDNNPALTTDQRGLARQSNGAVDIGAFQVQTPTAAAVTVSGRVTAANGRGLPDFTVQMIAPDGNARTASTNLRGQYKFENVPAGATYILTVTGKRYRFEKATRTLNVNGDLTSINFVAVQ